MPNRSLEELKQDCLSLVGITPWSTYERTVVEAAQYIVKGQEGEYKDVYRRIMLLTTSVSFSPTHIPVLLYLSTALQEPIDRRGYGATWFYASYDTEEERACLRRYWGEVAVARSILATPPSSQEEIDFFLECMTAWQGTPEHAHLLSGAICRLKYRTQLPAIKAVAPLASGLDQHSVAWFLMHKSVTGIFMVVAFRPDLCVFLGPELLRRLPRYQQLPGWIQNPASVTAEDRLALSSWQYYGEYFRELLGGFGIPVEVEASNHQWDWQPRAVKLPNGRLQVDEQGLLKGKTRLAWRVGDSKIIALLSQQNATGQLLDSLCTYYSLSTFWSFADPELQDLSADNICKRMVFRCTQLHHMQELLSFLEDTSHYQAVRSLIQPLLELWINNYVYGSNTFLSNNVGQMGDKRTVTNMLRHFPEYTPPPEFTASIGL